MLSQVRPRVASLYQAHQNFILLLCLFISFRAFTLLAYRPGGLVLDFSDFYWYREFAQLERQGYLPYSTIWTTYPPLFPALMLKVWQLSTLLPPWTFANLWFSLLLGSIFLAFETGNFILLYLIGLKLYPLSDAFKPAWIYAGLFVPVYTMTGWFESYPLFFFLLSLYLLLQGRPYLSAWCSGIGFMIKLIPLILLPVGVKVARGRGRWGRLRIAALQLNLDIQAVALYLLIFIITVLAIAYPFYRQNPDLILGSVQITAARQPWETVWALWEGQYDYGIIPLDLRDLAWQPADGPGSSLPWPWITLGFGLLYGFLYTRPLNWQEPKRLVAFTGLTVCLFFLYSKGYSPQWLGWLLVFNALLLPTLRGVGYAIVLSAANLVEANLYFIMFPSESWLLATTVLLRTALIIVLALEFGLIIWPQLETPALINRRRWAIGLGLALLLIGGLPAAKRLGTAYQARQLEQGPYYQTISWLGEQPVREAILLNSQTTYDWFYPYLRHSHAFFMLDDYAQAGSTVEAKTTRLLESIATQHQALWVYDSNPAETSPAEAAAQPWLAQAQLAHQADIDGGRLYLFIFQ